VIKPITPAEALASQTHGLPDIVVEKINYLLRENYYSDSAEVTINSNELMSLLLAENTHLDPDEMKEWFRSIDTCYENAGWDVREELIDRRDSGRGFEYLFTRATKTIKV
jgi:hypothetical protein